MRVFVDSSVWIAYLRAKGGSAVRHLANLLEDDRVAIAIPVRIELLAGTSRKDGAQLADLLSALPTYYDNHATWLCMEDWALRGAAQGQHFGMGDLLIAAIAAEHNAPIWSLDSDFSHMNKLGFVELFQAT